MNNDLIPVQGHTGLYRSQSNGAIINFNDFEYEEYMRTKRKKIEEKNELEDIKKQLNELKDMKLEIENIKNLILVSLENKI